MFTKFERIPSDIAPIYFFTLTEIGRKIWGCLYVGGWGGRWRSGLKIKTPSEKFHEIYIFNTLCISWWCEFFVLGERLCYFIVYYEGVWSEKVRPWTWKSPSPSLRFCPLLYQAPGLRYAFPNMMTFFIICYLILCYVLGRCRVAFLVWSFDDIFFRGVERFAIIIQFVFLIHNVCIINLCVDLLEEFIIYLNYIDSALDSL